MFKMANVAFVLALMFGVGWIFGILGSDLGQGRGLSVFLQFMFIIFAGCHGLFIFLLYPCRSKDARKEWKKWFYYITQCSLIYREQIKASRKKSQDQPSQHSSSTPSKNLSDITGTSHILEYHHPSSDDHVDTLFINPGYLPASFDDGSYKHAKAEGSTSLSAPSSLVEPMEESANREKPPFPQSPSVLSMSAPQQQDDTDDKVPSKAIDALNPIPTSFESFEITFDDSHTPSDDNVDTVQAPQQEVNTESKDDKVTSKVTDASFPMSFESFEINFNDDAEYGSDDV